MSVTVIGVNKLFDKIDKVAKWSERDSKKLQDIGHRVGAVFANYLKANVKEYHKPIIFRGRKISPGTLRRSAGTWLPDKNRNNVMGGPRTNAIGRRKTKKSADGFFAHIVEKGDFGPRFGGKHRTQNTGVFSRGLRSTKGRSQKLQAMLLTAEFARYVKAA
tara:strand:+ start:4439 stop:4921 length:483 start_codon:yes stop_codon:yes gene_type:complete